MCPPPTMRTALHMLSPCLLNDFMTEVGSSEKGVSLLKDEAYNRFFFFFCLTVGLVGS